MMWRILVCMLAGVLLGATPMTDAADRRAASVEVVANDDGTFLLLRNGEPYEIRGAGGVGHLPLLVASGGNSIRTWHYTQLDELVDGKPLLDRAHELGLSVVVGIWVRHKRHGFDYGDQARVKSQREDIRRAVLRYKDHPAVLMWGLGNEVEAFQEEGTDVRIWHELEYLASMIKELDGHHPIMTAVAGATPEVLADIEAHYPSLDILGVNAYGSGAGVGQLLASSGWTGPYVLTEFGVEGWWEVPQTDWGAEIEPDPSTKAAQYYATYTADRKNNAGRTLGSYAFVWGHKQEATATWFSMFLETGEKLPVVDAMAYAWTGKWPENRAPKIESLETPAAYRRVPAGAEFVAAVDAVDREGDALRVAWELLEESADRRIGGDKEAKPPSLPQAIKSGQGTAKIRFAAPRDPGAYRLFVTVFDGQGGAASHNVPFFVNE